MRMKVSLTAIVIAAAIALFTVLISALIPSIRATRVTAIEAIRQSGDIKAKNIKSKTSRITYRLFGLSGVIAQKHFRRSRKRYRSTIMSLFMSIVLFISAASFTMYMKESIEGPFGTMDYDIQFSSWAEEDEREERYGTLNRIFSEDENVKEYVEIMQFGFDGTAERSILSDKIKKEWLSEDGKAPLRINIAAYFIDDVQFRKLAEENKVDVSDFYKDEPACILFDGAMDFNGEKGRYETVEWFNCDSGEVTVRNYDDVEGYYYAYTDYEGDEPMAIYYSNESSDDMLTFPEDEVSSSVDIKFLARTTEKSFYINGQNTAFIFPMSAAPMLMSEGAFLNCPHQYMIVADGKPDKAMNSLSEELESAGFEKKYLYNYAEDKENERNIILIVNVFSYGFIVIISLIATANVFNTITTNMKLRRREFAMLRSVGMTMKAMKKMLVYECLMYGGKALLWGLPASAAVSYLIYKAISNGMEVSFRLPAGALIISVLSVFAVVFATMIYSMHKIKKDNLIDALKNETA
ncbi:MAG: ABC transporter permease [Ruminococcus sp.]|nr:ABC transporter permease [Ruminococcus sp.]